jgi:hypothetical protein
LSQELRQELSHVLWIGGATDAGKSTIARNLADRYGLVVYHYDKQDAIHHDRLAGTVPQIRKFMEASLDERWVYPEPAALFEFLFVAFSCRFPLVVEDLLALTANKPIVAEGFGLLPDLVDPILSSPWQAIWLVPTETFKWESMARRGKPSFAKLTSNPEKARMNLFARDTMLADYYREHVTAYGYTLYEIDGSASSEEMTTLVHDHFFRYLSSLG